MARSFEIIQKAGLRDDVRDLLTYETLCSQGAASASWRMRDSPLDYVNPGPQHILQIYGDYFGKVYTGAGKGFRPAAYGRISLDDPNESGRSAQMKWAVNAKEIPTELMKLCAEGLILLEAIDTETCARRTRMRALQFVAYWHYRFERIHPFKDGNGRIGRCIMNHQIRARIHARAFAPACGDEETRKEYIWALKKTGRREDLGALMGFLAKEINQSSGLVPFPEPMIKETVVEFSQPPFPLASW